MVHAHDHLSFSYDNLQFTVMSKPKVGILNVKCDDDDDEK